MQGRLSPVNPESVDPRIARHLEADEIVLWQDQPSSGSLPGTSHILAALALCALGLVIATGAVGPDMPSMSRYVPAAVTAGTGLWLITRWRSRAMFWSYAITDRRLVSVLRKKLIRSVTPGQLDRYKLQIKGDTVYWLRPNSRSRSSDPAANRGPDGSLIGFHGQADPRATKSIIENWRQDFSDRASSGAAAFVATMSTGTSTGDDTENAPPPAGALRVRHPASGLELAVLPDWKVTVKTRTDGPLKLFGFTVLPRLIRDSPERPYEKGGDWNTLSVRGAPEAGLELTIYDKPLELTLDAVLNDPFTRITGTKILHSRPDLRIGPFTGFSVIRRMPAATQIKSVPSLSAPAMLHQLWLSRNGTSLEVTGYALESQTGIQDAIDAMIASIRSTGSTVDPIPATTS
jgi:hypothetical protein